MNELSCCLSLDFSSLFSACQKHFHTGMGSWGMGYAGYHVVPSSIRVCLPYPWASCYVLAPNPELAGASSCIQFLTYTLSCHSPDLTLQRRQLGFGMRRVCLVQQMSPHQPASLTTPTNLPRPEQEPCVAEELWPPACWTVHLPSPLPVVQLDPNWEEMQCLSFKMAPGTATLGTWSGWVSCRLGACWWWKTQCGQHLGVRSSSSAWTRML